MATWQHSPAVMALLVPGGHLPSAGIAPHGISEVNICGSDNSHSVKTKKFMLHLTV